MQRRLLLGLAPLLRRADRNLQARLARQPLHRLRKRQPFAAHDEADHVAMGSTAEAMEEVLVVADREGRALLVVERAEAGVLPAALLQPDPAADHLGYRQAIPKFLDEFRRNAHAAAPPCSL